MFGKFLDQHCKLEFMLLVAGDVLSFSLDLTIILWVRGGVEVGVLVCFRRGSWLAVTPRRVSATVAAAAAVATVASLLSPHLFAHGMARCFHLCLPMVSTFQRLAFLADFK